MLRRVLAGNGKGAFKIIEEPMPEPTPGELTIEVMASSISAGTELSRFAGKEPEVTPEDTSGVPSATRTPASLRVGEGCEEFRVGQRAAAMGAGYAIHGTHANVPVNMTWRCPTRSALKKALNSGGNILECGAQSEPELGQNALVVGMGIVGQFVAQLARLNGAHVLATGWPLRLNTARELGFDVCGVETSFTEDAVVYPRLWYGCGLYLLWR